MIRFESIVVDDIANAPEKKGKAEGTVYVDTGLMASAEFRPDLDETV